MTWISVKESLPEEQHKVLVLDCSGNMSVRFLYNNGGWYPGGLPICNSTYWKELPEIPKEFR